MEKPGPLPNDLPHPDTHCGICGCRFRYWDKTCSLVKGKVGYEIAGKLLVLVDPIMMSPKLACDKHRIANSRRLAVRLTQSLRVECHHFVPELEFHICPFR
jgi:hypothetical protein